MCVIIVRKLFLGSEIQNDRNYHLWQYHRGESEKPLATKYLDLVYKNNRYGFKSAAEISKGNLCVQSRLSTGARADILAAEAVGAPAGEVTWSFITTGHTSHRFGV